MIPIDPDDLAALAGEYVLGTLEVSEADEVTRALPENAALAREVAAWEARLHPLSELAGEADPPLAVWRGIAARLPAPRARPWNSLALWRGTTLAASAVAAGLVAYIALHPPVPPPAPQPPAPALVAVLHPATGTAPAWLATVADARLSLRPLLPPSLPAHRAFQLWVIGRGEKVPRSLGVLPPGGELARGALPAQVAGGAVLAISIEPEGGSPTGLPTGPVVFVGNVQGT